MPTKRPSAERVGKSAFIYPLAAGQLAKSGHAGFDEELPFKHKKTQATQARARMCMPPKQSLTKGSPVYIAASSSHSVCLLDVNKL